MGGFDAENLKADASRIIFTNGLNDGWSVGGFLKDLSPANGIFSINFPNGAHHSDLAHDLFGDRNTPDVIAGHQRAIAIISTWLQNIRLVDNAETVALI